MIYCIHCYFDWISWSWISGVLTSVFASLIVVWVIYLRNRDKLRKKFGKAKGKYNGYGFESFYSTQNTIHPNLLKKTINYDKKLSTAIVSYKYPNILKIEVTHWDSYYKKDLVWEGDIYMESETRGSVAWRYKNLPDADNKKQHSFGLKQCIVNDIDDEMFIIYMLGEQGTRFGREIFIKEI